MDLSKLSMKKIRELIIFTVLLVVALWKFEVVIDVLKTIWGIIFPFVLGGAIAFVINVPMSFLEKKIFGKTKDGNKVGKTHAVGGMGRTFAPVFELGSSAFSLDSLKYSHFKVRISEQRAPVTLLAQMGRPAVGTYKEAAAVYAQLQQTQPGLPALPDPAVVGEQAAAAVPANVDALLALDDASFEAFKAQAGALPGGEQLAALTKESLTQLRDAALRADTRLPEVESEQKDWPCNGLWL